MRLILLIIILFPYASLKAGNNTKAFIHDGKTLFRQNCRACHAIDRRIIGPALKDVTKRVSYDKIKMLLNQTQYDSLKTDPYFKNLFEMYPDKCSDHSFLSDSELQSILEYIENNQATTSGAPNHSVRLVANKQTFHFLCDSILEHGKIYEANLILSTSPKLLERELKEIIRKHNPNLDISKSLIISKYISAKLSSIEENKTIEIAKTSDLLYKPVNDTSVLRWTWHIKTLVNEKINKIPLVLTIYLANEKYSNVSQSDHDDERIYQIHITAKPTSTWVSVANFFKNYWQWIIGTVFIPIIVFAYTKRSEKKKNERVAKPANGLTDRRNM